MSTVNQLIAAPSRRCGQEQGPALGNSPAEARRLHPRLHDHAEEAELGAAESRQGAPHQRLRVISYIGGEGHNLQEHSGC